MMICWYVGMSTLLRDDNQEQVDKNDQEMKVNQGQEYI